MMIKKLISRNLRRSFDEYFGSIFLEDLSLASRFSRFLKYVLKSVYICLFLYVYILIIMI